MGDPRCSCCGQFIPSRNALSRVDYYKCNRCAKERRKCSEELAEEQWQQEEDDYAAAVIAMQCQN